MLGRGPQDAKPDLVNGARPTKGAKRHDRGQNSLHLAISRNDCEATQRLIESGDEALLNQQTPNGITPLMLLASGHCNETLIWRLLQRTDGVGAALRSHERHTAADYAENLDSMPDWRVFQGSAQKKDSLGAIKGKRSGPWRPRSGCQRISPEMITVLRSMEAADWKRDP